MMRSVRQEGEKKYLNNKRAGLVGGESSPLATHAIIDAEEAEIKVRRW